MYDPPASRGYSPAPSQYGMNPPVLPYNQSIVGRQSTLGMDGGGGRQSTFGLEGGRQSRQSAFGMEGGGRQSTFGMDTGRQSSYGLNAQSRPGTQYMSEMGMPSGGGPSDQELETATVNLLSGADLNSITKREVRRRLEGQFGCDLTGRKAVINAAIDRVLAG